VFLRASRNTDAFFKSLFITNQGNLDISVSFSFRNGETPFWGVREGLHLDSVSGVSSFLRLGVRFLNGVILCFRKTSPWFSFAGLFMIIFAKASDEPTEE
jgi:hypothetical protein